MSEPGKASPGSTSLRPPEALRSEHELSTFDSGEPTLDDWLRRRAMANESRGGSRSYVVCEEPGNRVVAFYSLAAGAVTHAVAPGRVRRNMPDPIPVMVLGRLAVNRSYHSKGLGRGLLRDAMLRTLQAAQILGIRAILVHAISDRARQFYERCGFHASPIDPRTLMISLAEVAREVEG